MLRQRTITSVASIPFIILLIWFGDPWFTFLIAAVVLIGSFEFYHMSPTLEQSRPLMCVGLLWALAVALNPHYEDATILPAATTAATVISLVWLLRLVPREEAFRAWAWIVAGVLYVGWMLSYWLGLLMLTDGRAWVYLAMFTTFAYDTGAFFAGRAWGKHRLASAISPGKTWEGALGGLLSAVVAALAISQMPILSWSSRLDWWQVIILACLVSLFAQLGDLVESLLKRNAGVKQSGKLLPGHGGILDRFDSLIFVGVVVYYYATCLAG